jgi:hypothetical protein
MNQNNAVLMFSIDENRIITIDQVSSYGILPYYLQTRKNLDGRHIKLWLEKRIIPELRPRIKDLLAAYGLTERFEVTLKNHSLSLSDSYWTKLVDDDISWAEINFFDNSYSQDTGLFLLGNKNISVDALSPDICTTGIQPKLWIKNNGIDYLMKFGRAPYYQEPTNEVVCSQIAMTFPALNAVKYEEIRYADRQASICKNFICKGLELVPAYYVYDQKEDVVGNTYSSLIHKAKNLGMDIREFLNELIILDYIINNRDRNLGNIAFLRDMDTGEFLGPAPVFDNGNSMWFNEMPVLNTDLDGPCKPFAKTFEKQLNLIKSVNIKYSELSFYVAKAVESFKGRMEIERCERIEKLLDHRLKKVEQGYVRQHTWSIDKNGIELIQ